MSMHHVVLKLASEKAYKDDCSLHTLALLSITAYFSKRFS